MPVELKICGINSENIIQTIVKQGGCKYLGFVFYPHSPRNLSIKDSKKLTAIVPNYIKKVAVLVKPKNSFIEKIRTEIYDAIKSGEKDKAGTLRTLLAKLIDKRIHTGKQLTEQDALAVIKALVKQRKESVVMYENANRPELADNYLVI
jgi:phosphoribosylanthranilate isomerase